MLMENVYTSADQSVGKTLWTERCHEQVMEEL